MVGLRGICWVGCCTVLAMACGRTASSDDDLERGDGRSGAGGTAGSKGGGASTGGSEPAPHGGTKAAAGETAEAGAAAECPVTPATGQWVGYGADPYGLKLTTDGSHLNGTGCLGGLPSSDQLYECSPLTLLADKGRSVDLVWTMKELSLGYGVKLQLTLSPERTELAGKVWISPSDFDGEGQDIVFVRTDDEPVPAATACSGGEPSGECFLAPLRSDRLENVRIVELGGGDLLLLWRNERGLQRRIASTRFDATTGTWQAAEFLDDGSAPVDWTLLSASPGGWAMVAYVQSNALWTLAYDPETKLWSKQPMRVPTPNPSDRPRPEELFVYDGGNATLVASNQSLEGVGTLAAYDYRASNEAWLNAHVFDDSPESGTYQWAAASDSAGHELAVWVHGGEIGKPFSLWFSARSRSAASDWTTPTSFFTSDKQILRPAVAVGPGATALVSWQEWLERIGSSAYSFETRAWSEPLTITSETGIDNHGLRFDDAGAAVAYLDNTSSYLPYGELKSVLSDAGWSAPEVSTELEASGVAFELMGKNPIQISRVAPRAEEKPLPPLDRPRCEGY